MKKVLSLLWQGWKKLAHVLGIVNTKILLTVTYLVIIAVVAIISRLSGADLLDRRMKPRQSYWHDREPADVSLESARRQF
jgi:hypothetical protein